MTITVGSPLFGELNVTSKFGNRPNPIPNSGNDAETEPHSGIDLAAPAGTQVRTIADAYIIAIQYNDGTTGRGNSVLLLHSDAEGNTMLSSYSHMQGGDVRPLTGAQVGDRITNGTVIGNVGSTGRSTGPHLHFELRVPPRGTQVRIPTNPDGTYNLTGRTYTGPNALREALERAWSVYEVVDPAPYLNIATERELPPASTPYRPSGNITPYIASYKSFHPKVQYELTRRKFSTETVDSYMPFVNLTALLKVEETDILNTSPNTRISGWCPSLGIHNYSAKLRFNQIYNPTINVDGLNNRSIVGMTTSLSGNRPVRTLGLLARNTEMEPSTIPMPGIVSISTERSLAGPMGVRGGLFRANIKMVAYSIGQVDTLLKYFLRPSTPLVLEFGRMSTKDSNETFKTFNWNRTIEDISTELRDIVLLKSNIDQDKLINRYVYDNYGNYEIFVGYAVKFNIKQNKDNIFEIELAMNSTQQFELTNVHTGVKANCPESAANKCFPVDIREYFSDEFTYKKYTFEKVLASYATQNTKWKNDIVAIADTDAPQIGQQKATGEKGYLVTWSFFVDVILNDENFGLLSIFPRTSRTYARAGLISKIGTAGKIVRDDTKLIPNEVGYHPFLRSTNPGVMLIINKYAQANNRENGTLREYEYIKSLYKTNTEINPDRNDLPTSAVERKVSGDDFVPLPQVGSTEVNKSIPGVSTLLEGVWINTNAIKEVFMRTDTVSQAIQALLTEMNNATEGYWNLQLLSSDDSAYPGLHVVDMALSKKIEIKDRRKEQNPQVRDPIITNVTNPISNKADILNILSVDTRQNDPKYIYVFNQRNRYLNNGDSVGSELIDLNVNLDLPIAVATQVIAGVGGSAQKGTLKVINTDELDNLKLFPAEFRQLCTEESVGGDDCGGLSPDQIRVRDTAILQEQYDKEKRYINNRNEWTGMAGTNQGDAEEQSFWKRLGDITGLSALSQLNKEAALKAIESAYQRKLQEINTTYLQRDPSGIGAKLNQSLGNFSDFGSALQYVEFNAANMMKKMNLDSRSGETNEPANEIGQRPNEMIVAHAFNSSNLTKVLVDLTLPGIGGIQIAQSFIVDRIPSIVSTGFYMVTKVVHEISPDRGWVTKLQGRFRYAPQPSTTISAPT